VHSEYKFLNVKTDGIASNHKLYVVNLIISGTKSWAWPVARTAQMSNTKIYFVGNFEGCRKRQRSRNRWTHS